MPATGARYYRSLMQFDFKPSVAISAARIDKLGIDIRSFKEPLKRVVKEVMIPSFRANFAAGGRPEPWEPLSPSYALLSRGSLDAVDDHILVASGKLRRVMGQQNIWDISKTTATIKSLPPSVWYGMVHQSGSATGGVPQRVFALFQTEDITKAEKIFADWMMERFNHAWPVGV